MSVPSNQLHTDFELYSTYEDALSGDSPWQFCNFDDAGVAFPRDCGPEGPLGGQWNSATRGGQDSYAFYIDQ